MYNKKLSIRTQQEQVAELTSFGDKSIFQINTSNNVTSNSLIFEVQENNAKIKLYNDTSEISEILSFNNNNITISSNITINNNLNVSNLNVYGTTTTINTSTYETENLEIINTQLDAPSLKIQQSYESTNPNNILDVGSLNSSGTYEQKMVLDTNGNLNITGNIDFNGNLTNSGNTLIYNENSLKTFLSGKNVTILNLSQNGEIKINDQTKKFHWSYDIGKSDVSNSIYYTDTNLLSDISGIEYGTGQLYKSHVNITADIQEGKYTDNLGFLIQNRQRTNAIGFGYNTISQVGNDTNGYLNIKSKGNLPVCIGNETTNILHVFSDKIGIGTSLPTEKLTVYDGRIKIHQNSPTDNAVLHLLSNTYNTYLFTDKTNGSFYIKSHNNNDVIIDSNGNFGINTIPQTKLHVRATNNTYLRVETDTDANLQTSGIEFGIPSYSSAIRSKITSTTHSNYASDIRFYTNTTSSTNAQARMIINTDGNIGINNLTPNYNLDIDGIMRLGTIDLIGSHGKLIFSKRSTNTALREAILGYTDNYEFAIADGTNTNTGQFKIAYSAPENTLYCNSIGNVGIGTNNPEAKLHVNGALYLTNNPTNPGNTASASFWNQAGIGPTISGNAFSVQTNGTTESMRILSNGNVGIGTDSPTEYLTINGNNSGNSSALGLRNGSDATMIGNGAQISFGWNGLNQYQHFIHTRHNSVSDNNAIDFYVCDGTQNNLIMSGSTHTMSLVSGKVGIGTNNPDKKLHVIGDIKFTGNLYQNNGLFTSYTNDNTSNYLNNLDTHIIPLTDETIDIGSVDKKIRDIYVSNNSIWMGDSHKLMVSGEKLRFKKRNKNIIPTRLSSLTTDEELNTRFPGKNKSDLLLHEWLEFAKEKDPTIDNINEVFEDNETNYLEQTNIDFWLSTSTNIYLHGDYQNVGIGVSDPLAKFTVYSPIQGDGILISEYNSLLGKNSNNDKTQLIFWNGSEVYYGRTNSTEGSLLGVTSHNFRTGTTDVTTLKIIDNKVGIGIDTPIAILNVHNTINNTDLAIRTSNSANTIFNTETLWLGKGDINNNQWGLSLGTIWSGNSYIQALSTNSDVYYDLILQPNGGNIGINNKQPTEKLDIDGNAIISSNLTVNNINIQNTINKTAFIINQTIDQPILEINNNNSNVFLINYQGNVGINNINPLYNLDVNGSINFTGDLKQNGELFTSFNDQDAIDLLNTGFGGGLKVTSGNVGIGTSNPLYDLDVNGSINFTGDLKQNGELFTSFNDQDAIDLLNTGFGGGLKVTSGNVGIGTSNPLYDLDVNGSINFTTNINNVSSQSLDYIKNLDEDIIYKITQTSNLLDNKSSNYTNNVYNLLNDKLDNINTTTNIVNTTESNIYIDNSTSQDINYIGTYIDNTQYIDVLNYDYVNITVLDNIITNNEEITNNLYTGDIIKLVDNNGNIKYEFVKTYYDNKLIIFNSDKTNTGIVDITNIKYIKQNYKLLFTATQKTDLDSKFVDNIDYTKININSNKIYNFNININFDLTIGADNCKLYIKLHRDGIESQYVRLFTLLPISKNNITTTLNASFSLFLRTGDIITFESNYKVNTGNIDINTNNIISDDNNILFIGSYEKTVSYIKNIEYNEQNIIVNNNIADYINVEKTNKLSNGDLINIYNDNIEYVENIKRVYETSENSFTIYDNNNDSRGTIIESNNKYIKYNYGLKFNNTSLVDINYSELNIINNTYTKINIKSKKIYLFNITCVFDLLYGTDYCKLYIKLKRLNENPIYIRKFESPPLTSQSSNKTSTISNSFVLNLIDGDEITFESNYEIFDGFLDIQTKEYNNIIDNIFFIGLYQNNINYIKHLNNNNNNINIINNIAYYNNIDNANKLSVGDIINLYTQNEENIDIKTINSTTQEYFTIYNEDFSDSAEINSVIKKYSKYNYRLLFNNLSFYEINNSKYNVINNSYTLINISANSIYSFSIGCSFDLTYGTDYCKLYIRLDRKNEESKYIRIFDIYPIKSLKTGYTGTLSASFKLKLQNGDIISFETNYKLLNGFLDVNTLDLLDYDKINNTTPWITSESIQNLPWYANNTSFIGTYMNTFNFIENFNLTYKSITNSDNNKFYVNNLNNFDINDMLYNGDILKLKYNNNTYYRRINQINYTNNYFTLYNTINEEIVSINNYTEFIKANYLILFDYVNDTDNNSNDVFNDNNYTEVKIPSDRIYNFNINVNFDLTHATDYCRFYVKLKNTTTTKYIRTFYLEPVSMFNNISSSLNASFKLKLKKNDIITFESNYRLNEGYLDIDL